MTKEKAIEELEGILRWYESHFYNYSCPDEYEAIKFAIDYINND